MEDRFRHESTYRGSASLKRIAEIPVALSGTGAVGSNLAVNLSRQGFARLILIDRDRVEPHNLGTQIWAEADVGLYKAEVLRNRLYEEMGVEAEARVKELTAKTAKRLLQGASILVDSFDNSESRQIIKAYGQETGVPCLHVGLNGDYGEVIWNENYRVPSEGGHDVCDYPLARNLILMAVAVASECLTRFILKGEKKGYTITLGDFAVRDFPLTCLQG